MRPTCPLIGLKLARRPKLQQKINGAGKRYAPSNKNAVYVKKSHPINKSFKKRNTQVNKRNIDPTHFSRPEPCVHCCHFNLLPKFSLFLFNSSLFSHLSIFFYHYNSLIFFPKFIIFHSCVG